MDDNDLRAFIAYQQELQRQMMKLSEDDRYGICDQGWYNDTIRGYLILAMQGAGCDSETIKSALNALYYEFDSVSAKDAAAQYHRFLRTNLR